MSQSKVFRASSYFRFMLAVVLGAVLAVGVSVWATTLGTNISGSGSVTSATTVGVGTDLTVGSGARVGSATDGTHLTALADNSLLVVGQGEFDGIVWFDDSLRASSTMLVTGAATFYGASTFGDAAADINLFTGTVQASTTALFTDGITTYGNSTFGDAAADRNFFTGTLQASTTALFTGAVTTYGNSTLGDTTGDTVIVNSTVTIGSNGTSFTNIIHGFCDFGPITASQSIAATSTGTIACTTQAPTGHALGDKIWLTASTTASGVVVGSIVYTGIASSTAAGRIQAMIYNGTGAAWTVTTSSWQYFIIK